MASVPDRVKLPVFEISENTQIFHISVLHKTGYLSRYCCLIHSNNISNLLLRVAAHNAQPHVKKTWQDAEKSNSFQIQPSL